MATVTISGAGDLGAAEATDRIPASRAGTPRTKGYLTAEGLLTPAPVAVTGVSGELVNIDPLLGRVFAITPSGVAGTDYINLQLFPLTVDDTYAPQYVGQRVTLYLAADPGETVVQIREDGNTTFKTFPLIPFQSGTTQKSISLSFLGAAVTFIWMYEDWFLDYTSTHQEFDELPAEGVYSLTLNAYASLVGSNAAGGYFQLYAGNGDGVGAGGAIALEAGAGGTGGGNGGGFSVTAGTGRGGGDGGDLVLTGGEAVGGGNRGQLKMPTLPTSDPMVAGALYVVAGALMVSAGP